jgi:hypothetical protein
LGFLLALFVLMLVLALQLSRGSEARTRSSATAHDEEAAETASRRSRRAVTAGAAGASSSSLKTEQ